MSFVVALKGLHCHQKVCPLFDEKVTTSALGQLTINLTCIFKVFPKLATLLCNKGNLGKPLKILVKLILHCLQAQVITYKPRNLSGRCFSLLFFFFSAFYYMAKPGVFKRNFHWKTKENVSPHVRCNFSHVWVRQLAADISLTLFGKMNEWNWVFFLKHESSRLLVSKVFK